MGTSISRRAARKNRKNFDNDDFVKSEPEPVFCESPPKEKENPAYMDNNYWGVPVSPDEVEEVIKGFI